MSEWSRLAQLPTTAAVPATVHAQISSLVRAGERPADVVAFETAVVGFFIDAAEVLGVPKSVAAIYGICFASAEPVGFTEIDERLEISSGSISQGLKVLREVGALKVVTSPLEKRDRFEPEMEMRKLVLRFLEKRVGQQLDSGNHALQALLKQVPAGENGSSKRLKARLKAVQAWHDKGRALVPVIRTFLRLT